MSNSCMKLRLSDGTVCVVTKLNELGVSRFLEENDVPLSVMPNLWNEMQWFALEQSPCLWGEAILVGYQENGECYYLTDGCMCHGSWSGTVDDYIKTHARNPEFFADRWS